MRNTYARSVRGGWPTFRRTLGGPRAGRIAVDPSQIDVPPGEARFSAGEVINYTDYKASGVVSSITAVPSAASGSPAPGV